MKKILALVLAAIMALGMVSAFADDSDLAAIQAKGVLVVGITDFAPMDYKDADGNWIGIDADLAAAFAASLGVTVEFQEIEWDNKILELDAGTVDCIWNGMTLTDEVNAAMNCTAAYMNNAQVIVLPAEKLAAMPDETTVEELVAALADMTFAVEAGSAGEAVGNELGLNVTSVLAQADALTEVAAGTSDGAIIDSLMAIAMVGEGTSYAALDYGYELTEEEYVVGFRKGSDLTDAANAFLASAAEDGTIAALIAKYLGE